MNEATRTKLFGVLVLVGQPVSSREMVDLCRPLGLSATNVKSHLTRLVSEGALVRSGPNRMHLYSVSPERQKLVDALSSRLRQQPDERWDGQWLMIALKRETRRPERERLKSSLWFDGFRPCAKDTVLRPAWPRTWAITRAESLTSSLAACVIGPLVGTLDLAQLRKLYRLTDMDARARRLTSRITAIGKKVDTAEQAFVARLAVGGMMVELVSHVPRLPAEIWGPLSGLREARSAYSAFEARVAGASEHFVASVLGNPTAAGPRQRRTGGAGR